MTDTLTKKDCMKHKAIEKFAIQNGCTIRHGKGDHSILEYENNRMTYVRRDMGYGLACSIYKWFKLIGLLVIIITLLGALWQTL